MGVFRRDNIRFPRKQIGLIKGVDKYRGDIQGDNLPPILLVKDIERTDPADPAAVQRMRQWDAASFIVVHNPSVSPPIVRPENVIASKYSTLLPYIIPQMSDKVYNNAGVYYKGFYDEGRREILDYDFDAALPMYSVNAVGAFRVTKALLQRNLLQAGATVCMTSSEAGSLQYFKNFRTYEYTYCMSKAALNKGATLLYNDIGRKGMRVICFHPGWMKTQMGGEGATVSPNETARGFMKFTLDFNSSSRENMFFKYDGTPLPW